MHYLIDGYNYLHRAKLFDPRRLEAGRSLLAFRLAPLVAPGDLATIFWDAKKTSPSGSGREVIHKVEMIYCHGSDGADGAIRAYLRLADAPEDLCVVTDDREVAAAARQQRAAVLSVRAVEEQLFPEKRRRGARKKPQRPRPGPPPATDADEDEDAKPAAPRGDEIRDWLEYFGGDDAERAPDR
jgi:predicted RNA-binding protein with PIN domain